MISDFSDRPLVAGSIRGLRTFRVRSDGVLTGVSMRQAQWSAGVNEAECLANYFFLGMMRSKKDREEHQLAGLGCGCGFYAYFDGSNEYRLYLLLEELMAPGSVAGLTGIIEGTGLVTVGSKGFRAAQATIVALVKPEPARLSRPRLLKLRDLIAWVKAARRTREIVAKVRQAYPEVAWYSSVTEALEAHPLSPPPEAEAAAAEGAAQACTCVLCTYGRPS